MKVVVVSRRLVKPCSPTPSNLRTYNLSIMDEMNPAVHIFRILYYNSSPKRLVVSLEESLAKTLGVFYPLAGRYIKEKSVIDCNDEGAEYAEAQVDCDINQVIGGAPELLTKFLSVDVTAAQEVTDPICAVQINKFQCGGLAVAVCTSHKFFDTASFGIFLQAWANAAVGGDQLVISPDFSSASVFPAENIPSFDLGSTTCRHSDDDDDNNNNNINIVTRRFVFDKNAISKLRDSSFIACGHGDQAPSRVMLVTSVLARALHRADSSRNLVVSNAINLRQRTIPPLPKYAIGSWVFMSFVEYYCTASNDDMIMSLEHYVSKMQETIKKDIENCSRILSDKEFGRWLLVDKYFEELEKATGPKAKLVWNTDWSKFGDYELDFGFGELPIWVSLAAVPCPDICVLLNTKDNDGIEAWVCLKESDMNCVEQDKDLKMLTTK